MERESLKTYENLTKIFETKIKIDHLKHNETPEDVLINYEKYCKKIDTIYNNDFEKDVKEVIAPGVTLEEEEKRLKKLISLLEKRLELRREIEDRFYNATGTSLRGFQMIVSKSELESKKNRLELISKYLDTKKEMEEIASSIGSLENSLSSEEAKRDEYLPQNKVMEDELYQMFVSILKDDEYFKEFNEDDIDAKLVEILDKVKDSKDTLEVTRDSVKSLTSNGVSDDYSIYVEDAEKSYFVWKNRELLLRLYTIISKFEDSFNDIYEKRGKITSYIMKRKDLMNDLHINSKDELEEFNNLLKEQVTTLENEKEVLDNITNYVSRINFKEERLSELDALNNSDDILSILREYGLVDIYEAEKIQDPLEEELPSLEIKDTADDIIKEVIDPYRIVEIKDYPITLNIGLARLKGESVRDKITKKLNANNNVVKEDNITLDINNSLPVWETPSEVKEENTNEVNNAFWTQASDNKVDNSGFPNINIPITGFNEVDSLGFPTTDNN